MTSWIGLWGMVVATGCGASELPGPTAEEGPEQELRVPMSDGTQLWTKLLLPEGDGPFGAVLIRVPYPMDAFLTDRCRTFNRYGHACAFQMVRGRGDSQGEWEPFVHEEADGRDTIAWLRSQPWSSGKVAMVGESYLAATQWALAADPPPGLVTIVPTVFGPRLDLGLYEGGLFRHDILTAWMALMPGHEFRYFSGSRRYHQALDHRPRIESDLVSSGRVIEWARPWYEARGADAAFWKTPWVAEGLTAAERTPLPVLSMAGWSDAFVGPQLASWQALATASQSTLVIGPWDHLSRVAADVEQTGIDDAQGLSSDYFQWPRVLDWVGHHLRGDPLQYPVGGVLSYVVNGGGWAWRESFPPSAEPRSWALAEGEDARRCRGALAEQRAGVGSVSWTYDPADPTPSHGGAGVLAGSFPLWTGAEPGFLDQGRLCEKRDDLVGFVSEPLAGPLHVAGGLRALLTVASDAPDTAVNVRFLEERADGRRIHVREAITSLSAALDHAYVPGRAVQVQLETWPVEYVFEAGSRLLVQVGSASFPKYEAHANTLDPWQLAVATRVAHNRVDLGASRVELPVVP